MNRFNRLVLLSAFLWNSAFAVEVSDPSELYARRMTPKKVEDSLVWEHYDVLRWDLKELPVGFQWAYGEQGERKPIQWRVDHKYLQEIAEEGLSFQSYFSVMTYFADLSERSEPSLYKLFGQHVPSKSPHVVIRPMLSRNIQDRLAKLNETIQRGDKNFERRHRGQASGDQWLEQLNDRLNTIQKATLERVQFDQPHPYGILYSKSGSPAAISLLLLSLIYENNWHKDLPGQLGVLLANNHIEPVLIHDRYDGRQVVLHLISRRTLFAEDIEANIYSPHLFTYAWLNGGEQPGKTKKSDLLMLSSQATPTVEYKSSWWQYWMPTPDRKFESTELSAAGYNFGTEPYLVSTPLEEQEILDSDLTLEAEEVVEDEEPADPEEDSVEEEADLSKMLEQAFQEVTEDEQPVDVDAQQEIIEIVAQVNAAADPKQAEEDKKLLEKLKKNEKLSKEDMARLKKLSEEIAGLRQRKPYEGQGADFVVDPTARVATKDELSSRLFDSPLAFRILPKSKEQYDKAIATSQKWERIPGYNDYRLLASGYEIVFRSQSDVDYFNALEFPKKYQDLISFAVEAIEESVDQGRVVKLINDVGGSSQDMYRSDQGAYEADIAFEDAQTALDIFRQVRLLNEKVFVQAVTNSEPMIVQSPIVKQLHSAYLSHVYDVVDMTAEGYLRDLNQDRQRRQRLLGLRVLSQAAPLVSATIKQADPEQYERATDLLTTYVAGLKQSKGFEYALNPDVDALLLDPVQLLYPALFDSSTTEVLMAQQDIYDCMAIEQVGKGRPDPLYIDPKSTIRVELRGLPQLHEKRPPSAQSCLVLYFDPTKTVLPGEKQHYESYPITERIVEVKEGAKVVRRLSLDEFLEVGLKPSESKDLPLQIGPGTFWGVLAASSEDSLSHPGVQLRVVQMLQPDTLEYAQRNAEFYVASSLLAALHFGSWAQLGAGDNLAVDAIFNQLDQLGGRAGDQTAGEYKPEGRYIPQAYLPLVSDIVSRKGQSLVSAIPFVAAEKQMQQLFDEMSSKVVYRPDTTVIEENLNLVSLVSDDLYVVGSARNSSAGISIHSWRFTEGCDSAMVVEVLSGLLVDRPVRSQYGLSSFDLRGICGQGSSEHESDFEQSDDGFWGESGDF